jgi:hypothetical protein
MTRFRCSAGQVWALLDDLNAAAADAGLVIELEAA